MQPIIRNSFLFHPTNGLGSKAYASWGYFRIFGYGGLFVIKPKGHGQFRTFQFLGFLCNKTFLSKVFWGEIKCWLTARILCFSNSQKAKSGAHGRAGQQPLQGIDIRCFFFNIRVNIVGPKRSWSTARGILLLVVDLVAIQDSICIILASLQFLEVPQGNQFLFSKQDSFRFLLGDSKPQNFVNLIKDLVPNIWSIEESRFWWRISTLNQNLL